MALSLPAFSSPAVVRGCIREPLPETPAAREARHQAVAHRKAGPVVMVHRGASAFAPENTLEAYSAAMDYGADGCEVDLRRTADGQLVLFHDDMLDHLTDGFGTVPQLTYYELLSLKPRFVYGTAGRDTRPPTFAALLELARHRAMLLHLDVKEPGLEDAIAGLLERADAWDHVVAVNTANAPRLARDPRLKLLRYKGPGLFEGRRDVDPEAVRAQLALPGEMIIVDDPRVAARELHGTGHRPEPLPSGLRATWEPSPAPKPEAGGPLVPWSYLQRLRTGEASRSPEKLLSILASADPRERTNPDGSPEYERGRTERIVERAYAAQRLGELNASSPRIIQALEEQVRRRSLHRDWMYHGLDGAMAARALGMLGAAGSVPVLVRAFLQVDPELKKVENPEFAQNPLAWTDFRTKMTILPALGDLRCAESKQFLQQYVMMDPARARELAPLLYEDATRALLRQKLTRAEIESLLRSPLTDVRGTASLECLDHPNRDRTAALRAAAPWALELPRAVR